MKKTNLFDFTYPELEKTLEEINLPRFRAKQLFDWLYKKLVFDFDLMSNFSSEQKRIFAKKFRLYIPTIEHVAHSSSDSSYKFLLKTDDGKQIESVLIKEKTSSRERSTICVSCMVGCPLGCKFCATGSEIGFVRKLSCAEIVGQVLAILKHAQENNYSQKITNIVFMGMGEPFLNIEQVQKSIALFTSTNGISLSPSKIAVSTAGIGPGIAQFINETGIRLAVSLHFPTNELRSEYMPINKQFPLDKLFAELKKINLKKRDHILIEYLMLDGINDTLTHVKQLQKLVHGLKVKINLIPYNPIKKFRAKTSSPKSIENFVAYLKGKGIFTSVRHSKGIEVEGGCGQLALKNHG
ncbi:23S rRNA (adenine(2503)-C(2))-methyltransferase RlmN [Candidatus Dependentiae bacterium]|nr:23S rRNA (adenine(2503)-C(2))-methyltransferase RlmN [Candidatus Dependentiae bacterium]